MDAGGISAVIFAILFVMVGAAYAHKLYTAGDFTSGAPSDSNFLSLLVLYFPNTLFAYGFIADLMNGRYHYSVASLTALGGMITNKVLAGYVVDGIMYVLSFLGAQFAKLPLVTQAVVGLGVGTAAVAAAPTGVPAGLAAAYAAAPAAVPAAAAAATPGLVAAPAAVTAAALAARQVDADGLEQNIRSLGTGGRKQRGGATDLCSLPGFEWLENKTAPQGIVMSMTVFWYLMIELWDTGAGAQSAALSVTMAITFLLQWLVLTRSNCLTSYKYGSYSALIALVMGITFAGTSYGIQKHMGNSRVPPVPSGNPGTFVCPPGTSPSLDGQSCEPTLGPGGKQQSVSDTQSISVGGSNEKSQAVNDQDQFVCEAYKDGELVTSTVVE